MTAVTDAYAAAAAYRGRIKKTDTGSDSLIDEDLLAVSRYIDVKAGRFFTADANAVARTFYPAGYLLGDAEAENPWRYVKGGRTLYVDDISVAAGTSIVIDDGRDGSFSGDTALASTDFQLQPLNADKGPEPGPFTSIYIPTWSTRSGFPPGCMVQVTAKWGWPAVPKAIVNATIHLTGILRLESPRATQRVPEDLDKTFAMSNDAQNIISRLIDAYARSGRSIT